MKKIVVQFNSPGMTAEQYDKVWEDLQVAGQSNPKGLIHHVGAPTADGWMVVDVWESSEHFNKFGEILMPILTKNGVPPMNPVIMPLHFVYSGSYMEVY